MNIDNIHTLVRVSAVALAMVAAGCASQRHAATPGAAGDAGYRVTAVERTRLLVDSRLDRDIPKSALRFMQPFTQRVDSVNRPLVGHLARAMRGGQPESLLSNLLADIMVWAGTEFGERPVMGVYNVGGIRASLPAGDITFGNILEVAPFENKICFLTLRGDHLLELFGQIAACGGQGVSHGVELVITPGGQLLRARLNGKPVDTAASYRIATIDYVAEGNDKMVAFKKKTQYNAPAGKENDARYVIASYFRQMMARGVTVDAKMEGRITVKEQ